MWATSSVALATPSTTETRSRSMWEKSPSATSSKTCLATASASSCAVSIAGTVFGGTPKSEGTKST
ncbi:hypothetical protein MYIN104542_12070 [Mycobacterium intermedium]